MGCNGFHMWREYPERYEEYKALRIPSSVERAWSREVFFDVYADVVADRADIGVACDTLNDIVNLRDAEEIDALVDLTRRAASAELPPLDRVVIAETIVGRTEGARDGLIYRSFHAGRSKTAAEFARLALKLTQFTDADAEAVDAARAIKMTKPVEPMEGIDDELLELLSFGFSGHQLRERHNKARALAIDVSYELGLPAPG
jgi:hypothetical protein